MTTEPKICPDCLQEECVCADKAISEAFERIRVKRRNLISDRREKNEARQPYKDL